MRADRQVIPFHNFQTRAIEFGLQHKSVYYAVDMGLGKTLISLEWMKQHKQPTILFAPLRPCFSTWPDEIKKWGYDISFAVLHGPGKDRIMQNSGSLDLLIVPYSSLKYLFNYLIKPKQKSFKWLKRSLILDESSFIKSHSTQRYKMLVKMIPLFTEYKVCLSATPAPNCLSELFSQYYVLCSHLPEGNPLGRNISYFRKHYCESFSYPNMPVTLYRVPAHKAEDVYKAIAPRTFRLEAKDHLELPDLIDNTIKLEFTPKLLKQYKTLEKEFFLQLDSGEVEAFNAASLSMKLRQFIQGGLYINNEDGERVGWEHIHDVKIHALKELIESSAGQPILCAIQFRFELEMLRKAFGNVPAIVGGCSAQEASRLITSWNRRDIPLLLCHPASLAHGVNMQSGGSNILWYGLTWSLEQYLQLIGRLYRQGQKESVVAHRFVVDKTVDVAVAKAIEAKTKGQGALLDFLKEYRHAT